jgi:hypothetical protein
LALICLILLLGLVTVAVSTGELVLDDSFFQNVIGSTTSETAVVSIDESGDANDPATSSEPGPLIAQHRPAQEDSPYGIDHRTDAVKSSDIDAAGELPLAGNDRDYMARIVGPAPDP